MVYFMITKRPNLKWTEPIQVRMIHISHPNIFRYDSCEHIIMLQNWARIGPMPTASVQFWLSSATLWHMGWPSCFLATKLNGVAADKEGHLRHISLTSWQTTEISKVIYESITMVRSLFPRGILLYQVSSNSVYKDRVWGIYVTPTILKQWLGKLHVTLRYDSIVLMFSTLRSSTNTTQWFITRPVENRDQP